MSETVRLPTGVEYRFFDGVWHSSETNADGERLRVSKDHVLHQALDALATAQRQRDEALRVLRALWTDVTGGPKACGHEFSCACAGDLVRALLARERKEAADG